jgi:uncharacterized protein with FMN-binding domain
MTPQKRVAAARKPPPAAASRSRKGKLSGGIIAISTAAIISVYTLGRSNTSAVSGQFLADAPTPVATVAAAIPTAPAAPGAQASGGAQAATATQTQPTATPATGYKDGTFVGSGNSRHGGMQVTVVISGGKITSANVTSCSTRYPCSDVDRLISLAVSGQGVPANHVSGASDSSQAYKQALTNALKQAKA